MSYHSTGGLRREPVKGYPPVPSVRHPLMFQTPPPFLHWRVPASVIKPGIPSPLKLDTFKGEGWIGVTPFLLVGLARPSALVCRGSRSFLKRIAAPMSQGQTAVPGVWFFALEAARLAAGVGGASRVRIAICVVGRTVCSRARGCGPINP